MNRFKIQVKTGFNWIDAYETSDVGEATRVQHYLSQTSYRENVRTVDTIRTNWFQKVLSFCANIIL